jgi:hypothetical protein
MKKSKKNKDENILTSEEEARIMNSVMIRFFRPFFMKLITKEDIEFFRKLEEFEEIKIQPKKGK